MDRHHASRLLALTVLLPALGCRARDGGGEAELRAIIQANYAGEADLAGAETWDEIAARLDSGSVMIDGRAALRVSRTPEPGTLGVRVAMRGGRAFAEAVEPGSPADRAGIVAGGELLSVDGAPLAGKSVNRATRLLAAPVGTRVALRFTRPEAPRAVRSADLTTEPRLRRAVPGAWLVDGVGVVRLDGLGPDAALELAEVLSNLDAEGAQGVVLDLRSSSDGTLESALEVCRLFLGEKAPLVSVQGKQGREDHFARETAAVSRVPLAVLIGAYTAGAGEVVAGALQANDRARLVGAPSAGMGGRRKAFVLPDGRVLRLTVGAFVLPGGLDLTRAPLTPDVPVAVDARTELALASAYAGRPRTVPVGDAALREAVARIKTLVRAKG